MILLGLGANLDSIYGSPENTLQACSSILAKVGIHIVKSSNIWKSAPVPISDQPWYYNAVCVVKTDHSPHELLEKLSEIEKNMGRKPAQLNAARVIDLDILSYNNKIINEENLKLPHPRMHERAFVLYPLQEINPDWQHISMDKSVDSMIKNMPQGQEIEHIEDSKLLCTYVNDETISKATTPNNKNKKTCLND